MSPKVKKESAKEAKAASSKAEKGGKKGTEKSPEKTTEKAAKGKKDKGEIPSLQAGSEGLPPAVDQDELEEAEDEAAAAASGGGGNAAALAAAGGEISASFKNFRHHPDMENFYRFIFENDLRHEALTIIDQIMVEKKAKRALQKGKH